MFGSLIGAATSLVGGLFNRSEAAKERKARATRIQTTVKDAKAAGIHPLAALGAASNFSPVVSGFGDTVSQAGAAVANAMPEGKSSKGGALDDLNKEQIRANIEATRAQTELYRSQALNASAEARSRAVGAVGGKNTVPQFGGMDVPYMPKTSTAQELEDKHGELGDMLAAIATLNGIDPSKPNPFFYIKKVPSRKRRKYGPTIVGGPQP